MRASATDSTADHPRVPQRVGSFEVEPIRVTHSIADATALAIRTDAGLVIHTGDFKFDDTPPDSFSHSNRPCSSLHRPRFRRTERSQSAEPGT